MNAPSGRPAREPHVTVIMQCYNELRWLRSSIEAVLAQSFDNFEFLIVDDGSTDGSDDYLRTIGDPRVQVTLNPARKKWIVNINDMASRSRGRLIKLLCPDDVLLPWCLEEGVACYERHPDVGYLIIERNKIDEEGRRQCYPSKLPDVDYMTALEADELMFRIGCLTNTSGLFVPRDRWVEVGGLVDLSRSNPDRLPICEDFEMMVRLQGRYPVGLIKRPCFDERFCVVRALSNPVSQPMIADVTMQLYRTLSRRLIASGAVSAQEASDKRIQLAGMYFHQAVHLARRGYLKIAIGLVGSVAQSASLKEMSGGWLANELAPRLAPRRRTEDAAQSR